MLLLFAISALGADLMRTEAGGLRFSVPKTWTRVPATADTHAARYRLPLAKGDMAETELVLSSPGEGKDSGAEGRLERWYSWFKQPDDRSSKDAASVTKRQIQGLNVTSIDLAGTYVGSGTGPVQVGVSGYRLLAAVVEGKGGPWVLEILGPSATVSQARADFDALLSSLEPHR